MKRRELTEDVCKESLLQLGHALDDTNSTIKLLENRIGIPAREIDRLLRVVRDLTLTLSNIEYDYMRNIKGK